MLHLAYGLRLTIAREVVSLARFASLLVAAAAALGPAVEFVSAAVGMLPNFCPSQPWPRAVVAGALCRHQPVRRHGPVLGEYIRHAGHADISREGIDGRTGLRAEPEQQSDEEARAAHCAKIEEAARSVAAIND